MLLDLRAYDAARLEGVQLRPQKTSDIQDVSLEKVFPVLDMSRGLVLRQVLMP